MTPLPPIRQLGLSTRDLDQLVASDRWKAWCEAEPALTALSGLEDFRCLRGEEEDQFLGALVRLAARSGGDDQLAAVAVVHQLGNSVRSIARRYRRMTDDDIEAIVAATMWEEIRTFDWQRRTQHFGGALTHATRRAVRRLLTSGHSGYRDATVVPVDPQAWHFDALVDHAARDTEADAQDAAGELHQLLAWAVERGHVGEEDVSLLLTLVSADRDNPTIPKWMRGACSVAAVTQVAHERGVCTKSVIRARNRALDRLRDVAAEYSREVA